MTATRMVRRAKETSTDRQIRHTRRYIERWQKVMQRMEMQGNSTSRVRAMVRAKLDRLEAQLARLEARALERGQ